MDNSQIEIVPLGILDYKGSLIMKGPNGSRSIIINYDNKFEFIDVNPSVFTYPVNQLTFINSLLGLLSSEDFNKKPL